MLLSLSSLIGQVAQATPPLMPAPEASQTGFVAAAQTGFALPTTPPPVPVDPGFALNLIETIQKGGVVMIPMIMLSIFVFSLIVERAIFLRYMRRRSGPFVVDFFAHWDKGEFDQAKSVAENHDGPIARMLRSGLTMIKSSKENVREALHQAALSEMPGLDRFMSTIGVIGTMMPILGLLGTVTGMISTFEVITVKGTGDPKALAGGISVALITTQTGLIFALPILLLHNFLQNRVDHYVNMMETAASRFLVQIKSDTHQENGE